MNDKTETKETNGTDGKIHKKVEVQYELLCSAVGLLKGVACLAIHLIERNEIEVDEKSMAIMKAAIAVSHGMAKDFGLDRDDLLKWAAASSAIVHMGGAE